LTSSIPYDPKIDIALDSLQTFTACFEALKDEHVALAHNPPHDNEFTDPKLLVVIETQAAVNKALLDLLESILSSNYPRAKHY